jgi:integrase
MSKRAKGEGSVRQRTDGKGWEARLTYDDAISGEVKTTSFYGPTAAAVRAKLDTARDRIKAQLPAKDSALRLCDWIEPNLDTGSMRVLTQVIRTREKGLHITTVKSERSRRVVPLSPAMVALLKAHRTAQAAERLRAEHWTDHGLVFCTESGDMIEPRNVLRTIMEAAKKAGVDDVAVHTLRHSAATAWLEAGTHIVAVANLLGHSSIAVTGDLYGHAEDATTRGAIDGLSDALGL